MIEEAVAQATYRTLKLPAFGTRLPHLGGTFWTLMRAKPGSGQEDYPLIVPHGPKFEIAAPWGAEGKDEPGAACMWDGLANTRALATSKHEHPAAEFCSNLNGGAENDGMSLLYLPSLREIKALFAVGCDAFDPRYRYWTSTQFSRGYACGQDFGYGFTDFYGKSWEGGRARAVRRCSIESLIP